MDFSKLTDDKLEQEMSRAKEIQHNLQVIGFANLSFEEKRQWKDRRDKLDEVIKLLDQERCRRTIKEVDQFFSRLEEQG
jgi:hypothetical protein